MEQPAPEQNTSVTPATPPVATVTPPVMPPVKPRRSWFKILLWLVVILALASAVYLYATKDDAVTVSPSNAESDVNTSVSNASLNTPANTATTDDATNTAAATNTATNTVTTTSASTTSWKNYTNTSLGFALTFTDAWEGYKTELEKNTTNVVHFYAPNTDGTFEEIFAIIRQTSGEYQTDVANQVPVGAVIYQDPTWVYTRQHRFDMWETSKLKHNITDVDVLAVTNSFKKL